MLQSTKRLSVTMDLSDAQENSQKIASVGHTFRMIQAFPAQAATYGRLSKTWLDKVPRTSSSATEHFQALYKQSTLGVTIKEPFQIISRI